MAAFSAKVDEHGQWFDSPLPGRLSDVFGLKTNAFYDAPAVKFDLERQVDRDQGRKVLADARVGEIGGLREDEPNALSFGCFGLSRSISTIFSPT
jgi:hypothetical protein